MHPVTVSEGHHQIQPLHVQNDMRHTLGISSCLDPRFEVNSLPKGRRYCSLRVRRLRAWRAIGRRTTRILALAYVGVKVSSSVSI